MKATEFWLPQTKKAVNEKLAYGEYRGFNIIKISSVNFLYDNKVKEAYRIQLAADLPLDNRSHHAIQVGWTESIEFAKGFVDQILSNDYEFRQYCLNLNEQIKKNTNRTMIQATLQNI